MKHIDPLVEDDEDEDELNGLSDERAPREIGAFIKHEDFNENLPIDNNEDTREPCKDLSVIEQVFVMDHDFVCVQRQRNEEFEQLYEKGLQSYIIGDWIGAQMAFNLCQDKLQPQRLEGKDKGDGPLNFMLKLMERTKAMAPDDWNNAYDWDKKPVPPEIDFMGVTNEDGSESEGAKSQPA